MGYASAMAWVLFLIILGLTVLVFRTSRRWVYYEGDFLTGR
jgi:multiple sugar transport system permease protein